VVVLGPDYPDSFADNIQLALRTADVDVSLVDPSSRYAQPGTMAMYRRSRRLIAEAANRWPRVRRQMIDRPVAARLLEIDPDLVISIWGYFEAAQVEEWRRLTPRATWVLWYPDAIVNLGRHQMFEAPYDYLFFKDPYIVDHLRSRTALPVHFLPQACNPMRHRTENFRSEDERNQYECDVAVAGNFYPYRALVLEHIPDYVHLRLYGNLYPEVASRYPRLAAAFSGRYVTGREKALAFRGARIALNTMHYGEIRGVNSRIFEATGCGGFVLTHRGPELDDYFRVGEEVAAFDSSAELQEAIRHYLHAPEERARIALAGQARAHTDHTYARRLTTLFNICSIESGLVGA
jgi:spore maturation protein CgeB